MTVLAIWLGVGLGNYIHFALVNDSILFHRRRPIPEGMARHRGTLSDRRDELLEGLLEAAFFVFLWPAQLGWLVSWKLIKTRDFLVKKLWGAGGKR